MQLLGAVPKDAGQVEFRVWAPRAGSAAVRLGDGEHPLERRDDGTWDGCRPARAGDDYRFALDGRDPLPDPCSRFQPEGVQGASRVIDTRFEVSPGPALELETLVIYELHVGTFTDEGTFDAAISHLGDLASSVSRPSS